MKLSISCLWSTVCVKMQRYILQSRVCRENKLYLLVWTMTMVSLYFQFIRTVLTGLHIEEHLGSKQIILKTVEFDFLPAVFILVPSMHVKL